MVAAEGGGIQQLKIHVGGNTFLVGQHFSVTAVPRQHHLEGSKPVARPQQIYLSQRYFDQQYSSTLSLPNLLTSASSQYLFSVVSDR